MEADILVEIKKVLTPAQVAAVLAALRQDSLVWDYIETRKPATMARDEITGENGLDVWSPAALGLSAVGTDLYPEHFRMTPMISVTPILQREALRLYEETLRTARAPQSLMDGVLLALAMRERRRRTGAWQGLLLELAESVKAANGKGFKTVWQTPFACLYGLIPDPDALLMELFQEPCNETVILAVSHMLLCQPLILQDQVSLFAGVLARVPLTLRVASVRAINLQGRSELSLQLAQKLVLAASAAQTKGLSKQMIDHNPEKAYRKLMETQMMAALYRLSGQPGRALELLKTIDHYLKYLMTGLRAQAFDAAAEQTHNGQDYFDVSENQSGFSDNSTNGVDLPLHATESEDKEAKEPEVQNPLVLIRHAAKVADMGDLKTAQEIAQDAVAMLDASLKESKNGLIPQNVYAWQPEHILDMLVKLGLVAEAIRAGLQLLKERPTDASLIHKLSLLFQQLNEKVKAQKLAHWAVSLRPDLPEYHRSLASLYEDAGNWDAAMVERSQVIELIEEPEVNDWMAMGRAALRLNQLDEVMLASSRVLEREPNHGKAHALLGKACFEKGQISEATNHLNLATLLTPSEEMGWLTLAKMERSEGDWTGAFSTLRSAVLAIPNSVEINLELAWMLIEEGSPTEALPLLRRAARQDAPSAEVALALGTTLMGQNCTEEARNVLEDAHKTWPTEPEVAFALAKALISLGESGNAIPALETAIQLGKADADRLVLYAGVLMENETKVSIGDPMVKAAQSAHAKQALKQALDLDPEHFLGRLMMGELLTDKGELESANEIFKILLDCQEAHLDAYKVRLQKGFAALNLRMGRIETALATLQEAAQFAPDDVDLEKLLAEAFFQADLKQEAALTAKTALKLAGDDLQTIHWYVDLMVRLGKDSEAIQVMGRATQLAPDEPDHWIRLAELQLRSGDVAGVQQTLHTLLSLTQLTVEQLRRGARAFITLGDPASARMCLERAVSLDGQAPARLLFELALVYLKDGSYDEALDTMQKVVESAPEQSEYYLLRADIQSLLRHPEAALASLENARQWQKKSDHSTALAELRGGLAGLVAKDWLKSLQSPAGMSLRSAYLQRELGNLQAASDQIDIAYSQDKNDPVVVYAFADQAIGLLQEDKARTALDVFDLERMDEESYRKLSVWDQRVWAALMSLRVELALQERDLECAQRILRRGDRFVPKSRRWAACQARVCVRSGNVTGCQDALKILDQSVGPTESVDEQMDLPQAYLETMLSRTQNLWLAEAALELCQWDRAWDAIEAYAQLNPKEPRARLALMRGIVLLGEVQRQYAILRCSGHAPSNDFSACELRFNALAQAMQQECHSIEITRWAARGRAFFTPDAQQARTLTGLAQKADDVAGLIVVLRQVGLITTAIQMGARYPDDPQVLVEWALCYQEIEPSEGVKKAKRAVDVLPSYPIQYACLALLAEQDGQDDLALSSLETALRIWPNEAEWHAWAAKLAAKMEDRRAALTHWQDAAVIEPEHLPYLLELAQAYVDNDNALRAVETLEKTARKFSDSFEVWSDLARAYRMVGRIKDAIECADRAGAINPKSPLPLMLCGEVALDMRNLELALEYAQEAYRRDAHREDTVLFLSRVLVRQNRMHEALSVLEQSLPGMPNSCDVLFERARLVNQVHGCKIALTYYKDLIKLYPDEGAIYKAYAQTQVDAGDLVGAEASAQEALRLTNGDADLNLLMGQIQHRNGQLDQAIHFLGEAIRLQPAAIESYLDLGKIYEERREYVPALRVYQQAIKIAPTDARPYYLAGMMMRESKDYSGAEVMLRRAAELAPDDLSIRKLLGVVITLNLVHNSLESKVNL